MNGFFITGTDTEVGKTWITTLLTVGLRKRSIHACPIKPIATGGCDLEGELVSPDALIYKRIAGLSESPAMLNPLCFRHPASPHLAAEMDGATVLPSDIIASLNQLAQHHEALIVEGIGGWKVPLTYDYTVADFAEELDMPVLLVCANRLGTLNHTLLTLESIRRTGVSLAGVIVTHLQPVADQVIAMNNIKTIQKMGEIDILGSIPYLGKNIEQTLSQDTLWEQTNNRIQWETIIHILQNKSANGKNGTTGISGIPSPR